uniref:OTU domain-containing protein n=1 Tax=viral metagenome TaxID=1070528 RepID=A0A6C0FC17_9ZZZZ|tara:strand:- start:16591 stop:18675 length:2085 start_codon:yes stop_codon:yes gene_type:complete
MLESKINKENVKYNENISIEKEDLNHMSFVYETELYDKDIEFVLGKEKHTYAKYNIIYFSVYLVINDKPKKRIGVFEIDSNKFIQSIDEDGSIELENGELLFFVQQNEMSEYFKKYDIKREEKQQDKESDKVDLEYEDLTDSSPDLFDESLDVFKVSIDDKKSKKQSPLINESIFEEKENVKILPILEEENEEISNNEKKKYEEKVNTTWIEKFTKNNNYNIIDNEGGGDCLFATIRDAFKPIGKITTIDKLRYHLSNELTEETYENYKSLYMAISNDYKQIKKDIEDVHTSEKKLTKDINESTDREKSDQLNELKKKEEEKRKNLFKDKKQAKALLQDFIFMDNINSFEEYKHYIRSSRFWGDTWALSSLEKILNIKIMVLSEESYPDHLDDIMQCGQINDQDVGLKKFQPDYYMVVSYTGNHYKLITYKDKTLFSFKEIPYDIKMMIINKCLEKNAGLYYLIQDFKKFKERMGMDPEEGKKIEDDVIHKDLYNKDIVFMFHEKSNNKPLAGMGNGESMDILQAIDSEMGFKELNNISDWRRKLDDSYESPFTVDGLRWNSVTHYFMGSQFKKGFPDFYKEFSLDSNSEFSTDLVKARAAGSNSGKLKDKLLRNESIKIDPDFYEIGVEPRYELERKIALEAKFTQNLDLLQTLMSTKNGKLVNFRRGKEPVVDELLMKLRKELGSNKQILRT